LWRYCLYFDNFTYFNLKSCKIGWTSPALKILKIAPGRTAHKIIPPVQPFLAVRFSFFIRGNAGFSLEEEKPEESAEVGVALWRDSLCTITGIIHAGRAVIFAPV